MSDHIRKTANPVVHGMDRVEWAAHQGNGVGSELFDRINELPLWRYAQNK